MGNTRRTFPKILKHLCRAATAAAAAGRSGAFHEVAGVSYHAENAFGRRLSGDTGNMVACIEDVEAMAATGHAVVYDHAEDGLARGTAVVADVMLNLAFVL